MFSRVDLHFQDRAYDIPEQGVLLVHILEVEVTAQHSRRRLGDEQRAYPLEELAPRDGRARIITYVRRMQRAGLINRTTDDHIFASRAAIR